MSQIYSNEPMVDMYIFETSQLLEQLEQAIISSEQANEYSENSINEIFRFMHTIKGSSGMMLFNNIAELAHSMEDLFYFLRENKPDNVDYSRLSDLVLEGLDFTKIELEKIKSRDEVDGNAASIIKDIKAFLAQLKSSNSFETASDVLNPIEDVLIPKEIDENYTDLNSFNATVFFEDGCEMENIRAYTIINELTELTEFISYKPENVLDDDTSTSVIRKSGFHISLKTKKSYDEINAFFMQTMFLKDLELVQEKNESDSNKIKEKISEDKKNTPKNVAPVASQNNVQSIISVNVDKLDKLMDLVGEMVIAEAMVTQNPEITSLELESFQTSSRRLHKITSEIQDMVMSIRMVPLSTTFMKMHRITRDMCKKLNRKVELVVIGEETEVDKNIIEHISDPLMHIIRNSIDHGIEDSDERISKNKDEVGTIILEAKNSGNNVLVVIKDDGRGLNKEKILKKARENNILVKKESDMSDTEIYNLILLPGFSTKENITEFSGRGVGMDVVTKNLEAVGGSVSVDSVENKGSTITLKIPLTLAIIDGMNIAVGSSRYTIPITKIKESFRPKKEDLLIDPEGNEMIMLRGECLPILRLHKYYSIDTNITDFNEGILIMIEQEDNNFCIFADELIGKQQVVVKSLPNYIKKNKKITGLAGCTLLGDGSISLILDTAGLTL
ncbi:chemotaxis protein CheA [Clostridium grantii]|uniref:Chemotaxis protein CheA n=1 Tax=Clostridium grantii DSM 8605 TaxID=1121316 RepID=A0A1M5W775_9CLOT|nr:chemotaxis protein CheA [Clostridium grantii]SHH83034.1 two-component system, chemotaxis family, sensor kinase CheA [Clostridium grantii DSM 8605]